MTVAPDQKRAPHGVALALIGALGLFVAGCSTPEAVVQPGSTLNVLGSFAGATEEGLPKDWIFRGANADTKRLSAVTVDSIPALKIENGPDQFTAVLRTKALLLATPFLSWAWNMEVEEFGDHPVRLVVGFWRGENTADAWRADLTPTLGWPGGTLPAHHRALTITWAESGLERGTLIRPHGANADRIAPHYVARGGRESTGQWFLETVDLADLYAQAWPGEDRRAIRISFIGITAEGGRAPTQALISGIRLNR